MAMTLDDILDSHRTRQFVVMGILNVTPDSFSDGGRFFDPAAAVAQARQMVAEGADILDIGAESTRPGSARVDATEQIRRLREVLPAVGEICQEARPRAMQPGQPAEPSLSGPFISIDTTLAEVGEYALQAGADILNDVSAGRDDPRMFDLAARRGCPIILMHMLGEPKSMQQDPHYQDVVAEVRDFLRQRTEAAVAAGVGRRKVIVDPGIGFGKRIKHNLALLAHTDRIVDLGQPVLIGASRKRFIGELTGQADPAARLPGTIAACVESYRQGATIFRVHDVASVRAALTVARAIYQARE